MDIDLTFCIAGATTRCDGAGVDACVGGGASNEHYWNIASDSKYVNGRIDF